jgi:hypothetical protein
MGLTEAGLPLGARVAIEIVEVCVGWAMGMDWLVN